MRSQLASTGADLSSSGLHAKCGVLCIGFDDAIPKLKFVLDPGIVFVFVLLCFDHCSWLEELHRLGAAERTHLLNKYCHKRGRVE